MIHDTSIALQTGKASEFIEDVSLCVDDRYLYLSAVRLSPIKLLTYPSAKLSNQSCMKSSHSCRLMKKMNLHVETYF